MRSKKAAINFLVSILELIVVTVSSFIVPHYVIHAFGSSVNGLVGSIKQFLSYIALIESGIGAIGRAGLYKPLADGDTDALSGSIKALENFYRKVAYIFLGYVAVLACLYPLLVNHDFEWAYTAALVVIIALSTFIQYYFGITYQTLVQSDQRKYISSLLRCVTVLLNLVFTIVFVKLGFGIHAVKLGSALAYTVRPIFLNIYVAKRYRIDRKAAPNNSILRQRWDGLAQHVAFFIHKNTDIAVLTILANVREVSVYSVYMLAVSGCSKVVNMFSSSLEPAFGNMIAKNEKTTLRRRMLLCSALTNQVGIALFSTAAIIISPFVLIYTKGVTDVQYLRPAFGIIMLVAELFYCIRMPYQSAVYAAGHFRQTRNGAIMEAALNIVLSVILVSRYGLIGVAIGTLAAMTARTTQYIWYYHVRLMGERVGLLQEARKILISLAEIAVFYVFYRMLPAVELNGYGTWLLYSIGVGAFCTAVVILFSWLFYRQQWSDLLQIGRRLLKKR